MAWDKKHLIEIDPLSRKDIENLFELADKLLPYSGIDKTIPPKEQKSLNLLQGKIMRLWFEEKEPSTRTYGSFQTAMERLGGEPQEFNEGKSSIKKKESTEHTSRILSGQCDIFVDRHRDPLHIHMLVEKSLIPVVNAGNGSDQHPTQTLLDLYTIKKKVGKVDGNIITIVGDLKYGRTTHSLMKGLEKFDDIEVHGISPPGLEMPEKYIGDIRYYPHIIDMRNLKSVLTETNPNFIYATRIQDERISWRMRLLKGSMYRYQINKDTLEYLFNVYLMHPLPIATNSKYGPEIATELDDDPRAIYFEQADNGIPMREAIIVILLGYRKSDIESHIKQTF